MNYFTASFFSPYTLESGYNISNHNPEDTLLIETEHLNETLIELDRRGFTTKIHAVGDYAIHIALNAIENARIENGYSGLRHEISHCPFIKKNDKARKRSLVVDVDFVKEIGIKQSSAQLGAVTRVLEGVAVTLHVVLAEPGQGAPLVHWHGGKFHRAQARMSRPPGERVLCTVSPLLTNHRFRKI